MKFETMSAAKQNKNNKRWRLPIDLKRVEGSLRLDGKDWMAEVVKDAITTIERQKKSLRAQEEKITRQRVNLNSYRERIIEE